METIAGKFYWVIEKSELGNFITIAECIAKDEFLLVGFDYSVSKDEIDIIELVKPMSMYGGIKANGIVCNQWV